MSIKRCAFLLFTFILGLLALSVRVFYLSVEDTSVVTNASTSARSKMIMISNNRGGIYDRNLQPLVNIEKYYLGVVDPQIVTDTDKLFDLSFDISKEEFDKKISDKKPFTIKLKENYNNNGVNSFFVAERYQEPFLASHTIGYINDKNEGVSGIEKAYDSLLKSEMPLIAEFPVDAVRRAISGLGVKFEGDKTINEKGIMLTLDSSLQKICDDAAKKYINNGAVVMMEASSGEILALSSMPNLNPTNLSAIMDTEGAFVNKCFTPFNVGSAFKICDSAVYLENNGNINAKHTCKGYKMISGKSIDCMGTHGNIDLKEAFSESCNSFFIEIMQESGNALLNMANKLNFGKSIELAPGLVSKSGTLPKLKQLESNIAVANFSIGQGDFMATPIQVASLVQTVANNGVYVKPSLVIGETNSEKLNKKLKKETPVQVFSENTAKEIQRIMVNTIDNGSAKMAKPELNGAGAKTSTAQTGIKKDDGFVKQGWVVGFFPAEHPKYVLAILAEDVKGGGRSCGPAFKYIADEVNKNYEAN